MNKRQYLQKSIIIGIILLLLPWGWSGKALAASETISRLILSTNELSLEVGDTYSLSAIAIYVSGNTEDVTMLTDWTSSDSMKATVYNGNVIAKEKGISYITATYSGKPVTVTVTVDKKVRSLTKNKTSVSMRVGATEQITLMATYTDGTTANVTTNVNQWSSSNDSVATVSEGLITGVGTGSTTITAKYGTQVVTIPVDIDKVLRLNLEQNSVTQNDLTLKVGAHSQIQLMALFEDGAYEDISNKAIWSSDSDSIAYAYKGLITAYKSGEATITASYGTKSVKIVVDVDVTKRLVADPTDAFIHVNDSKSISLKAYYADGTSEVVTTKAKWESDDDSIATVSNGVVSAFSNGTATISASYGGKTTTIAIDVDVARRLDLDSTTMQLNVNANRTAILKATYADGTVEDVTYRAVWSSDNDAVAIVSKGKVSAISAGQAVITAQFGLNSTKLVVDVDVAKSLTLNKTSVSLRSGKTEALVLTATLADGTSIPVTDKAVWTSDNEAVAYVTNGTISTVSSGQAVISAKYGNKTATITTQVEIPSRLEVNQSDIFMKVSDAQQLNLLAYFSGSSDAVDVTSQAEWTISNDAIAFVSAGLITGVSMGQTTIVGKYGGKSVSITVDVATPRRLTVNKSSIEMRSDIEEQTVVTATYASGETYDVTETAVWSTDNADVATVIKGNITSYKVGHATISAVYGGKKITILVNVDQATVLTANKTILQLQAGVTEQITISANYSDGSSEDITDKAVWKSNSTIAEVKEGLINAIDKGETKVTASYGDRTVTITVMIGIVASLELSQTSLLMKEGESFPAALSATFKDDTVKDVTGEAVWTSSSDKIAKVSAGVIKAYSSGKAIITVKYGGQTETMTVEVNLAVKLSINLKQVVLPKNSSVQLILTATQEQFMYWLNTHFGYKTETKNMEVMETLRIPYDKTIQFIDPAFIYYAVEGHLVKQVFDCLVRYNSNIDTIEPHLAHYWTKNEQGTEWCFYIRKGIYFHHGRELTAHDVKFTLERLQDDQVASPFYWLVADIERIDVVHNHVLRIYLTQANQLFLKYLSFYPTSIVPRDAVKDMGDQFMKLPIGTGPFKLVKNDDNMIVLEAYHRYFDKRAHLDRVEIWMTREQNPDSEKCDSDSYQMRNYLCGGKGMNAPAEWLEIETNAIACHLLSFNLSQEGPQQNRLFRRAMFHGLDRSKLLELMVAKDAYEVESFFPDSQANRPISSYNLQLAKRLLAESGYKQEKMIVYGAKSNQSMIWMMEQCELLGVQIDIIEPPKNGFLQLVEIKKADISIGAIVTEDESDFSLIEIFLSENSCIHRHMSSEQLKQMEGIVKRVYQEPSSAKRNVIAKELEQMLKLDDAVLFLYHRQLKTQVHPSLKGVHLNSLGWVDFRRVWFEQIGNDLHEAVI
ncbi:MAG: ABC transporter substrate-binding protein [Paenibacillaceae bacterium]